MLWLLLFTLNTWAAEQRWTADDPNSLRLSGGLVKPGLDFTVSGPGPDVVFVPNSPALIFFGVGYKNVGLSLQLPIAPDPQSESEFGRSRIHDYQLRFFGHRETHELIFQDFKGYALQDWKNPTTGRNELRPDLNMQIVGYNYITALSPAFFSNAVAYGQRGHQITGGGSWMLWGSAGHMAIKGETPMLPNYVINGRSRIHELHSLRTHYLLGGVAYGYQQPIFTKFYAVGAIYLGAGFGLQKAEFASHSKSWEGSNLHRMGLRLGTGYNYGNNALGLQMIVDQNTTTVADGQVGQSTFSLRLFYTYRWQDVNLPMPSFLSE